MATLLVEAARSGDRVAFGKLFAENAAMVHGVLMARVPPSEVEDLMQDVFVAAMEKLGSLENVESFPAWLATVARNRAIDWLRTRKKTEELPEDLPSKKDERGEAERVLAVIRTLPDAYRETLVLRLVEGMSGPEIAKRVGLTPESVRVNLHRGMKLLKEKIG
jgi:RNA polymerase sigma-70 factor (ECF subfamily)